MSLILLELCQLAILMQGVGMYRRSPYTWSGLGLLITAVALFCADFFIFHRTWLSALSICMFILSFILLVLGKAVPNLSPEVSRLLLETGIDNIATLIEELGITSQAIYIPSSLSVNHPRAFIPLHTNGTNPRITRVLPQRLISRYGANPEDVGLLISTIGSAAFDMLEQKPGKGADDLEYALTSLFSGRLGIADRTRVAYQDNNISVEIFKPRFTASADWSHQCLGGPLATITASIAAESRDKPVKITREELRNGKYFVGLEVIG
jgi:hypothetical protein